MKHRFSRVLETIPKSQIREFFDLVSNASKGEIISLGVGEPDFATPWTICEEAITAIERGQTAYTSNQGLQELRDAISAHFRASYKTKYNPDSEILITNGASEGIDIVLRALLNPGDEVILQQPLYVCYDPLIRLLGGKVVPLDTSDNGFIPDPKELKKLITAKTKMIVLCSPNNPTGLLIPKEVLSEIAKLAAKHDLWVLSDEIYSDIVFDGEFCSFSSLPKMKDKTIIVSGFSKAYAMTGWRVGYICGPEEVVSRACKIHQYSALCASRISQFAALEALRHGREDVHRMRTSYHQRMSFFVAGLREAGLPVIEPTGALYCFPSIKSTGLSSVDFAKKLLREEKLAVVPGDAFGVGGDGYIRCCFATAMGDLKEAIKRIQRFASRHQKKAKS